MPDTQRQTSPHNNLTQPNGRFPPLTNQQTTDRKRTMIQSHLIPNVNEDKLSYLLLDTLYRHRHVITSAGVGNIIKDDVQTTPTATQTLETLYGYMHTINSEPTIRFQEISTTLNVAKRVRKALEAANEKDAVFFVCKTPALYDATVAALNIRPLKNTM
ncbi:MAG: hypothetical protein PHU14_01580 [Methylovulum sp.]|nr:hypothetical protein [Methylovulum sp.]